MDMINVLIIDDNTSRIEESQTVIEAYKGETFHLAITNSQIDGKKQLSNKQFDLLIVDVSIPLHIGEDPEEFGGMRLLQEVAASSYLKRPVHVLAVTSFPELAIDFRRTFSSNLWNIVEHSVATNTWSIALRDTIDHIVKTKVDSERSYETDVAIITALMEPEFKAILDLSSDWERERFPNDDMTYHRASFWGKSREISVVAATPDRMGMVPTAVAAMKIIERYRPRYVAMSGICAGVKKFANFGDIVVPDTIWDHGSGKIKKNLNGELEFLYETNQIPVDSGLRDKVALYKVDSHALFKIMTEARTERPETLLKVAVGPFASGAAVIQYKNEIERIQIVNRKLIGIDMEAFSIFYAADNASKPKPTPIVAKSVVDFADEDKDDSYHSYAAYTSARFLLELLTQQLF